MKCRFCFSGLVLPGIAAFTMVAVLFATGCKKNPSEVSGRKTEEKMAGREQVKTDTAAKRVKLETSMGDIVIELNEKAAPVTVKNFLRYTEDGYYAGTVFHRVISNFMIQGGGFTAALDYKMAREPIINEGNNGLKNERGTVTMARRDNPNSANSQFFINVKANAYLNYAGPANPGYAVFGKVVEGMDVVDKIAAVKTATRKGMSDVPVEPVVIKSAKVISATAQTADKSGGQETAKPQ